MSIEMLTPNGQNESPAGTITVAFTADGRWGWKPEGNVPAGPAVNALMVIAQSFIGMQIQQQLKEAMQAQKNRVCLPDGTIPIQ